MEDLDLPSSPRKRLKMDPRPMDVESNSRSQAPDQSSFRNDEQDPPTTRPLIDPHNLQLRKEEDVGITEFVSPDLAGFVGILKKRYTDFLVNEILPSGQVVHLDTYKAPKYGNKTEPNTQAERESSEPHDAGNQPALETPEPTQFTVRGSEIASETQKQTIEAPITDRANRQEERADHAAAVTEEAITNDGGSTVATTIQNGVEIAVDPAKPMSIDTVAGWQSYAEQPNGFQLTPEDEAILNTFFESHVVKQTVSLFNRVLNSPHRKPKEYGSVKSAPIKERDVRTKIHQELRRIFSSRLESYTDETGSMIISASFGQNKWGTQASGGRNSGGRTDTGRQKQQKSKPGWKDLGGEYLHFTLYKENKDTMEVVSYLARSLKIKPQSFQFAGTKDRRGVTSQRVSVYRVQAERMVPVGKTLRNAKIGNYEYQPRGLELGELTGNEFVITLRDCQFDEAAEGSLENRLKVASSTVESAAKHLGEKGYINYYGLQRFGTFSTRTDTIGRKMLKGDFQGAVEAILDYHPQTLAAAQDPVSKDETISFDDKARAFAINSFQKIGKSYPALDTLPRKFSAETNIIRHLGVKDRANDYLGALQTIPRNLRLMYVHAYQSLIWNLAASHRWKTYGGQLHVGDLVLVGEHKDKAIAKEMDNVDADGEIIVQPAAEDSAAPEEDRFERARALTDEDITSGNYSIYDVVLPTPGFDILYPENEMKDFYEQVMASEIGGALNPYDMRRQWKDISLSGSYRKLLAKPMSEVTFSLHTYTKDDEQFVETDLDKIQKRNQPTSNDGHVDTMAPNGIARNEGSQTLSEALAQGPEEDMTPKIAVVLRMQLGSSQYATMALRELMKLGGVRTYKPDFGGGR